MKIHVHVFITLAYYKGLCNILRFEDYLRQKTACKIFFCNLSIYDAINIDLISIKSTIGHVL